MKRTLIAAGVVAAILAVASFRIDLLQGMLDRSDDRALEVASRTLRGAVGRRVSESKATSKLPPALKEFVSGVKKASPRARVDSVSNIKVTIEDTARPVQTATQLCDEYRRFCFDLPGGLLHRSQELGVQIVVVRSHDGRVRVAKSEFKEYDPNTHEPIPAAGVDVVTSLEFVQEPSPLPPILHLRPIAGVDSRVALAAGLEFLNLERTRWPILERFALAGMGYWKPNTDPRVALRGGYRLYGNLSVGGYVGVSLPSGITVGGVDATIQVGR